MSQPRNFTLDVIKFDSIITNVGGGYIDDDNNVDYGKFIVPVNGTYMFSLSVFHEANKIGMDLMKNNDEFIIAAKTGYDISASVTAILDLQEGDRVWVRKPGYVSTKTKYGVWVSSFSGFLIRTEDDF